MTRTPTKPKLTANKDWPPTITLEFSRGNIVPRCIYINAGNDEDEAMMQKSLFLLTKRGCWVWLRELIRVKRFR
jgi:hypothetical protein